LSEAEEITAFADGLRKAFGTFKDAEKLIRQQYNREVSSGNVPAGIEEANLLERPTRRFLIDGILRGLDWNPDDPTRVIEEARSWSKIGARLYFDYLGLAPRTRAPVMLVEAKGYDATSARRPRGQVPDARYMAEIISAALNDLRSGTESQSIIAEWSDWLKDLQSYVASLGALGRSTLKRVVITAGRWLIIFEDPIEAFLRPNSADPDRVHCFTDLDEIISRHATIFKLLHRQRLVDTLPLTIPAAEALDLIPPGTISAIFRGVLVATTSSGGIRRPYPTRSIYPAMILTVAGRVFGIIDDPPEPLEEPLARERYAQFLIELTTRAAAFETDLLRLMGRSDLMPLPLANFPGFRHLFGSAEAAAEAFVPVEGSTAALRAATLIPRRVMVAATADTVATPEYLVATGTDWFYKRDHPFGRDCIFHDWPKAKNDGVADATPHVGRVATSYTMSGEDRDCAHERLRRMRGDRCHIISLETHLCCRVCILSSIRCWAKASPNTAAIAAAYTGAAAFLTEGFGQRIWLNRTISRASQKGQFRDRHFASPEVPVSTQLGRFPISPATFSFEGTEEQFQSPTPSGRYRFGQDGVSRRRRLTLG